MIVRVQCLAPGKICVSDSHQAGVRLNVGPKPECKCACNLNACWLLGNRAAMKESQQYVNKGKRVYDNV